MTATTLSPREFDEKLADLYDSLANAERHLRSAFDALHYMTGERRAYRGKRPYWKVSDLDVYTVIQERAEAGDEKDLSHRMRPSEAIRAVDAAQGVRDEILLRITTMDEIYRQAPWQRFFPCRNADGHIHRSLRGCSTVKWDTDMGWYPSLSGKTVEEAIAELGPTLCSVCFPDAPVEWCRSKSEIAAEGKTYCEYGGQYAGAVAEVRHHGMRSYATCPGCGESFTLTQYGYFRKHEVKGKKS